MLPDSGVLKLMLRVAPHIITSRDVINVTVRLQVLFRNPGSFERFTIVHNVEHYYTLLLFII